MTAAPWRPTTSLAAYQVHMVALLGVIVLVPLLNVPEYFLWFDITPKVAALLSMVGLACCYIPNELLVSATRRSVPTILSLGMLMTAIVSTLFSRAPFLSIGGSAWRRLGLPVELAFAVFLLLCTTAARTNPRYALWCLRSVVLTLLLASFAVLLEFAGAPLLIPPLAMEARPGGVLGSGAAFGTYATAPIFLCWTLRLLDPVSRWRMVATGTGTFASVAVLACGTRSAALGILLGALVCLTFLKRRLRLNLLRVTATLAATSMIALSAVPAARERIDQIGDDPWGATRLDVWADTTALLATLPLFGYGLEVFPRIYPAVESEQTAGAWPDTWHESTHNYLLDTVLAKGVFGLAVAIACSVSAFCCYFQIPETARGPYAFALAAHVACLTSCMFFTPQLPTLLSLYLPVSVLWSATKAPDPISSTNGRPLLPASRVLPILVRSLGALLLAYVACLLLWDRQVYRTKMLVEAGKIDDAVTVFMRAREIAPPGVSAEMWFSRELLANVNALTMHRLRTVLDESLRSAIAHDEEFGNAYMLLAARMIMDGRRPEATSLLLEAGANFPQWVLPKQLLRRLATDKDSEAAADRTAAERPKQRRN